MSVPVNTNMLSILLTDVKGNNFIIDTTAIEHLYFIEDVFSFCISGKIKFTDHSGIMEKGNIWGYHDEKLTITYGIEESDSVTKEFLIYKIDKHSPSHSELEKNNVFEITFVSKLYYQWHFKQYSRSFKDSIITDIMKHIMKHMVGGEFKTFEASKERIDNFYTGLKSPAENFKYLMERASGISSGKPGYVCFENADGYNLVTLPSIMNKTVKVMEPNTGDNNKYWFSTVNTFLHNKIMSFEREGVDNSSMQQLSGGYRMGYDFNKKKNIIKSYSYKDCRLKFKDSILGDYEYPLLDPSITGQERFIKTGESREDFIDNMYYSNWLKQYSIQQLFILYVKGHEKRKAGGVIEIEWPSNESGQVNQNFTGRYFVKSVIHYFYKDQVPFFNQKLVLIKNAYDGVNQIR